ncbi:unnamed protein product [Gongylonema pulchrum]|uniref:PDZ domain-containing protein n=1 Tax=Gongylonema pulchrum TaxID=637853 RepID=A0A183ESG3_9BILA|nr:unnamed protein product [Gongylonema pulchrum]
MAELNLVLKRPSLDIPYGFTIRHIAFCSPQQDTKQYESLYALAVLSVDPWSAAADAGLEPGQRIIELNGQCVTGLTYDDICSITQRCTSIF